MVSWIPYLLSACLRNFQISVPVQPGKWQDEHRPLVDERGNVIGIVSAKLDAGAALAP